MPRKSQKIQKQCKVCTTVFEVTASSKKTYCSKKCSNSDIETKNKIRKSLRNVWDTKYNGIHPMSLSVTQDKHKQSMIINHGVEHALQNKHFTDKVKETKLLRHGSTNYNNILKGKQTKLEKYGNCNYNGHVKRTITKYDTIVNTWKHIIPLFTKDDFTGVSDNQRYKFQCIDCNNTFIVSLDNGYIPKCRYCAEHVQSSKSRSEYEIIEYIQSLNSTLKIEHGNRTVLKGKEIDIYIPAHNLGIEFNGIYWHSESKIQDKFYHIKKTKLAAIHGINLLHIFDYQWHQKQDIVKSIIRNKLGYSEKVYARKCIVKYVTSKEKNTFLEHTHIQGKANSAVNIGLYYNNELVCLATFGKSRYDKKYDYELIRFSTKLNTNVIGGFSKLLKYFVTNYSPKNILTYCDRTLSYGNVYYKNNFKLLGTTNPNYFYFKDFSVFPREMFQKHKLKDSLKAYDDTLTEYQNMLLNKFDRFWDCGNYKFVFNNYTFSSPDSSGVSGVNC